MIGCALRLKLKPLVCSAIGVVIDRRQKTYGCVFGVGASAAFKGCVPIDRVPKEAERRSRDSAGVFSEAVADATEFKHRY